MRYDDARAYLATLTDYERTAPRRYDTTTFDLARFAGLLARLGTPQGAYPIVHVAGTKGKGSACAMLAAAFAAAGRRPGVFTSPHLRSPRERVAVGGEPISPAAFGRWVGEVRDTTSGAATPVFRTYFETVLAAALLHFREERVDVAVLETGLGGRLDATNVVVPAVAALTTVELDHVDVLGATLEAIATEKAGVMKRGVPAVTAPQDAAVLRVFRDAAARAGAPLAVAGEDYRFAARPGDGGFDFAGVRYELAAVRPAMRGPAQIINGAVALATLERFRPFDIPAAAARAGVETGVARARLELFAGAPAVLVDTAHTAASAAALAAVIRELGHDDAVLVWGMSADKDVDAFARALAPVTAVAIATAAATPRARAAAELAAAATVFRRQEVCPSTAAALARARALAGPSGLVVVAGSFYVAGEALVALEGTVA